MGSQEAVMEIQACGDWSMGNGGGRKVMRGRGKVTGERVGYYLMLRGLGWLQGPYKTSTPHLV